MLYEHADSSPTEIHHAGVIRRLSNKSHGGFRTVHFKPLTKFDAQTLTLSLVVTVTSTKLLAVSSPTLILEL